MPVDLLSLPFLEAALATPLLGAALIAFVRTPVLASRWSLGFVLATFACATAASWQFLESAESAPHWLRGFSVDALTAPLLPLLGMLHLLVALGKARSRVTTGFCVRLQLASFHSVAAMTCHTPTILAVLLCLSVPLPLWDLVSRGRPIRGLLVYMTLQIGLLAGGARCLAVKEQELAAGLWLLALLVRGGVFPAHGWRPMLYSGSSLGTAMLFTLPLIEAVAAIRLVLPAAPAWMLDAAGVACLATAVYCGGLAIVQDRVRKFFAHLCLSRTALVLYGVLSATPNSLAAALCLWISVVLSLSGLGFCIRSIEARFGELSLRTHHGCYEQAPALAVCFFVAGLATVGFPGTVGFLPTELMVSGTIDQGLPVTFTLVVASMLNGLAIMRAYFSLFTGKRPTTSISLQTTPSERAGIVLIALLVFLGGWFSPGVVESRYRVAKEILGDRDADERERGPRGH